MKMIKSVDNLKHISYEIRRDIISSLAVAGSGHIGGSLGLADIFTVLYFNVLYHNPADANWEYRDRVIVSIGHVAPVLYSTLARAGYFELNELMTLRQLGSRLQGHPSKEFNLPGIEISTGSLGQGLSVSVGIALAARMDNKNIRIFTILGDGELQEGSVWEAAMSASFYKLNNLTAIVDRNFKQIDGNTEEVMALEPLLDKWKSFGWECFVCDGNDIKDIITTFKKLKRVKKLPKVIIAYTKMGKGVKSIENNHLWHGKAPTHKEAEKFTRELEKAYYDS